MKRIWKPWVRFWATDKSLSVLLLMLIIFALVLPALKIGVSGRSIMPNVIFTLLLITSVASVASYSAALPSKIEITRLRGNSQPSHSPESTMVTANYAPRASAVAL